MASPLEGSGEVSRRIAEDTGRHIRHVEKLLAEALSRHPHDNERLLQAIGAALLEAQAARHLNVETQVILSDEHRRKRRKGTTDDDRDGD